MAMTNAEKEECASQALAVIQAKFSRPPLDDVLDILRRAGQQAIASAPQPSYETHVGA